MTDRFNTVFNKLQRKYDNLTPEDIYGEEDNREDSVRAKLNTILSPEDIKYYDTLINNSIKELLDEEKEDIDEGNNKIYKSKLTVDEIVEKILEYINY